jgi:O-antigen/teichoic acid export membrane protein
MARINLALGFFYAMFGARYLGTQGFGVLSFATAFTAMFATQSDIGLDALTVQEIAREKGLASK